MKVEAVNSTAISVQWRPPGEKDMNGVIRGYQIHYTRLDEKEELSGQTHMLDIMDGGSTHFHKQCYSNKMDMLKILRALYCGPFMVGLLLLAFIASLLLLGFYCRPFNGDILLGPFIGSIYCSPFVYTVAVDK